MDSQPCVQAPYSAAKLVDFLLSYRKSAMGPAPRMEGVRVQASGDVNNNNNAIDHKAESCWTQKFRYTYTTSQSLTNGIESFCFRPPMLRIL